MVELFKLYKKSIYGGAWVALHLGFPIYKANFSVISGYSELLNGQKLSTTLGIKNGLSFPFLVA